MTCFSVSSRSKEEKLRFSSFDHPLLSLYLSFRQSVATRIFPPSLFIHFLFFFKDLHAFCKAYRDELTALRFFFKEMQFHLKTHFRCGIPSAPNLPFMNIEGFCLKNSKIDKCF